MFCAPALSNKPLQWLERSRRPQVETHTRKLLHQVHPIPSHLAPSCTTKKLTNLQSPPPYIMSKCPSLLSRAASSWPPLSPGMHMLVDEVCPQENGLGKGPTQVLDKGLGPGQLSRLSWVQSRTQVWAPGSHAPLVQSSLHPKTRKTGAGRVQIAEDDAQRGVPR